jgi:phosphate transport system permease protein
MSSSGTAAARLVPTSPRRRRTDRAMRTLVAAATGLALIPLVLIIYYLLKKGLGAISWSFLSTDPNGSFLGNPGGIKSAILGTIEIVAIGAAIAIPAGVGVAIYLTEYGRSGPFAQTVRFFVDVLTGVPSIVFGLFIYTVLVLAGTGGSSFAGWKGSIALALLMLPIVTRASEVVLLLIPESLRESALALGSPRWRMVARVVLPTALPGIVTGVLLAIARAAGETAPLLFTIAGVNGTSFDPNQRMNALPIQIFSDVQQAQQRLVDRAWGAALTLVILILLTTLAARLLSRRSRLA